MNSFFAKISEFISAESTRYNIDYYTSTAILFAPFLIVTFGFYGFIFPYTRHFAILMCRENYPVEILTFAFLFFAVVFGLLLFYKMIKLEYHYINIAFIGFFVFMMFFIAMEEIAWGQQFMNFRTPEYFREINIQGEVTLHNIKGLQGHSEFFRFAFGVAGLIGIYLNRIKLFRIIAVPKILIGGFTVISLISLVDIYNDYYTIQLVFDRDMRWMSEIIEMMIAIAGFFYVWLLHRKIKFDNHLYKSAHTV